MEDRDEAKSEIAFLSIFSSFQIAVNQEQRQSSLETPGAVMEVLLS